MSCSTERTKPVPLEGECMEDQVVNAVNKGFEFADDIRSYSMPVTDDIQKSETSFDSKINEVIPLHAGDEKSTASTKATTSETIPSAGDLIEE